jgi:histidinol phosphatase-like enzyme
MSFEGIREWHYSNFWLIADRREDVQGAAGISLSPPVQIQQWPAKPAASLYPALN